MVGGNGLDVGWVLGVVDCEKVGLFIRSSVTCMELSRVLQNTARGAGRLERRIGGRVVSSLTKSAAAGHPFIGHLHEKKLSTKQSDLRTGLTAPSTLCITCAYATSGLV